MKQSLSYELCPWTRVFYSPYYTQVTTFANAQLILLIFSVHNLVSNFFLNIEQRNEKNVIINSISLVVYRK